MDAEREKEEKHIAQHKKDAENTIKQLQTMKCNIGNITDEAWQKIKTTRIEHFESIIKSLIQEQKRFEHFK